jgi:thymidine kinase
MLKITGIIGCMFAGKSTRLIKEIEKANHKGKNFIAIKPSMDNRYDKDYIVTHDKLQFKAINVDLSNMREVLDRNHEIIFIDELQFFDESIVDTLIKLAYQGIEIWFSGLNYDYKKNEFANVKYMKKFCEKIHYLKAKCECGMPAEYSKRMIESEDLFVLGGEESYKPVCENCF